MVASRALRFLATTTCLLLVASGFNLTSSKGFTPQLISEWVPVASVANFSGAAVVYDPVQKRYLVVWSDYSTSPHIIHGRFLSPSGAPLGSPFTVYSGEMSLSPSALEVLPGLGRFVLVGSRIEFHGSIQTISLVGLILNASGLMVGQPFTIRDSLRPQSQSGVRVVPFSDSGQWAVFWQEDQDGPTYAWMSRIYDAEGNPLTPASTIQQSSFPTEYSVVFEPATQRFLIVWASTDGLQPDVYGRWLNPSGMSVSDPFPLVNTENDEEYPLMTLGENQGTLLLVWRERAPGQFSGAVRGRFYSPSGEPASTFTVLEDARFSQIPFHLSFLPEAHAFVLGFSGESGLYAISFSATGETLFGETLVSDYGNLYRAPSSSGVLFIHLSDSTLYARIYQPIPEERPVIHNSMLRIAYVSSPYETRLNVTGGQPPYVYSLLSGNFPAGLHLDPETGTIAGTTPDQPGTYTFVVGVTDARGATGNQTLTLSVIPILSPDITVGPDPRCFIATAAFGSPLAREVQTLREFRDRWLLTNAVGRRFTAWYYRWSPSASQFIAKRPTVRFATRLCLYPLVYAIRYPALAFCLFVFLLSFCLRSRSTAHGVGVGDVPYSRSKLDKGSPADFPS